MEEITNVENMVNRPVEKRKSSFKVLVVSLILSAVLILSGIIVLATRPTSVKINFYNNYTGGVYTTMTIDDGDYLYRPDDPFRSGYVFTGWYTDSSCNSRYSFSGVIKKNMNLYAGWYYIDNYNEYSETLIKPYDYSYNSYYPTSYTVSTAGTNYNYVKYIYLVAEESGSHYIYYKNDYSSYYYDYSYNLNIRNVTSNSTILSNYSIYSSSYDYSYLYCNAGDVIEIALYRDNSYSSTAYFSFSGFGTQSYSSAKVKI